MDVIGGGDPGLNVSAVNKGGDAKLNTSEWELVQDIVGEGANSGGRGSIGGGTR
jgi:hypothetical protein